MIAAGPSALRCPPAIGTRRRRVAIGVDGDHRVGELAGGSAAAAGSAGSWLCARASAAGAVAPCLLGGSLCRRARRARDPAGGGERHRGCDRRDPAARRRQDRRDRRTGGDRARSSGSQRRADDRGDALEITKLVGAAASSSMASATSRRAPRATRRPVAHRARRHARRVVAGGDPGGERRRDVAADHGPGNANPARLQSAIGHRRCSAPRRRSFQPCRTDTSGPTATSARGGADASLPHGTIGRRTRSRRRPSVTPLVLVSTTTNARTAPRRARGETAGRGGSGRLTFVYRSFR